MKRWAFNLAAGVSLVLGVAFAALCVRSYFEKDFISYTSPVQEGRSQNFRTVYSTGGVLRLHSRTITSAMKDWEWIPSGFSFGIAFPDEELHSGRSDLGIGVLGFGRNKWADDHTAWQDYGQIIVVPHIAFILVFSLLPGFWLYGRGLRNRRAKRGQCQTCGYDLRATPERCPECGTQVARASSP